MKKTLTLIIALCCAINLMAFDEEDYRAYAASMREQVWKKTALPEFDNHRCPPSMKKESAVILASYDEVTIDQRKRLRGNAFNLTLYNVRQAHLQPHQAPHGCHQRQAGAGAVLAVRLPGL